MELLVSPWMLQEDCWRRRKVAEADSRVFGGHAMVVMWSFCDDGDDTDGGDDNGDDDDDYDDDDDGDDDDDDDDDFVKLIT